MYGKKLVAVCMLTVIPGISNATFFTIDQHNDGAAPFQGYTTAFGTMGQSFSPGFDILDHVELQLNAQLGNTSVHIDVMDSPTGSVLGSSDTQTFIGSSIQLGHFELAPIDVSSYSSLFLSVIAESGTAGAFTAGGLGGNPYAGGAAYLADAPCCDGFQNSSDLWFRTGLTEVPIPAAVWLFGTGLLGLFGAKQHKQSRYRL